MTDLIKLLNEPGFYYAMSIFLAPTAISCIPFDQPKPKQIDGPKYKVLK